MSAYHLLKLDSSVCTLRRGQVQQRFAICGSSCRFGSTRQNMNINCGEKLPRNKHEEHCEASKPTFGSPRRWHPG